MEIDTEALKYLQSVKKLHLSGGPKPTFAPSFLIYGHEKGVGKTFNTFKTFPGSILCLSYDGQSEIILYEMAKRDPSMLDRIKVIDFYAWEDPRVTESSLQGDARTIENSKCVIETTLKLANAVKADWIMIDGVPMLNQRVNEYVRAVRGITNLQQPLIGNDLIGWQARGKFYDDLLRAMLKNSYIGPLATTYAKTIASEVFKKESKTPEWKSWFEWSLRNIIYLEKDKAERRFYAVLESLKGFSDLGQEGDKIEVTGWKPIFNPDILMSYKKGNPFRKVEEPKIDPPIPPTPTDDGSANTVGDLLDSL